MLKSEFNIKGFLLHIKDRLEVRIGNPPSGKSYPWEQIPQARLALAVTSSS